MLICSVISDSESLWTVAHQVPPEVHGFLRARILQWVAMPSSRRLSRPRNQALLSCVFCMAGGFFTHCTIREAPKLPCDPAIPLLGTYTEKNVVWRDTGTPIFTAALFIRAKTWKKPRWPLTEERINMWYTVEYSDQFSSVAQSCLTLCDPFGRYGPQHTRPPCPSPTPGVYSNSCPLSRWCHPTISSSVIPFSSSHLQSFPASGSFQMSQLFASGGQSIGVSASASVLPMNTQDWSPSEWTGWISLQSKGLSGVFSNTTVQKHPFFSAQLSLLFNSHIHTWPLEKP